MRNAATRFAGSARATVRRGAALAGALALAACGVLDVENPNNVTEDALGIPTSATALATGVAASVTRALTAVYAPYGASTDEFAWVGSREGYKINDDGNIADQTNEFVDAAFPYVAEARFMADDAISRLEAWDAEGTLVNRADLARTYLYGAIIYVTIADMFDDFVVASSKVNTEAPVGETQMGTLYDKAITFLDKGLVVATAINNATLRAQITGMRARAKFAKAAWGKVNPIGQVNTANPLINDAGADADAAAALTLMSGDFRYAMTPAVGGNNGFPIVGNDLNNRLELRAGDYSRDQALCRDATCDRYVFPTAAGNTITGVKYQDPVTNIVDPVLSVAITLCCIKGTQNNNGDYVPLTQVSAREMYLIRAEAALAQGDATGFTTFINQLRALNPTLTPYAGTTQAEHLAMLQHSRFVNLYNQGRRLTDMYRFGLSSQRWANNGDAVRKPGCFFPIPAIERLANEKITVQPLCRA